MLICISFFFHRLLNRLIYYEHNNSRRHVIIYFSSSKEGGKKFLQSTSGSKSARVSSSWKRSRKLHRARNKLILNGRILWLTLWWWLTLYYDKTIVKWNGSFRICNKLCGVELCTESSRSLCNHTITLRAQFITLFIFLKPYQFIT